jgi:ketosteroid isomerase-like protein
MSISTILLIPFFLLVSKFSFSQNSKTNDPAEEVKQADISFSNLSKEKGMNFAFLEYLADDGVLLRPNMYPVVGKDTIKKTFFDEADDKNLTLTWAPLYGLIAESGELGYTYGTWQMEIIKEDKTTDIRKGTYVTIWKKDSSGKWKFVLDTGNPGLEPKQ